MPIIAELKIIIKKIMDIMNDIMRVAFIYKKTNEFLTGKHFANTYYHFFMDALKRNSRISVTYFPSDDSFDTLKLSGKFDAILLFDNSQMGMPDNLVGINDLNIPVICRVNDPHDAQKKGKIEYHEKFKIDYYFGYMHESYFHEFYPKEFKFKTIIYGLEASLYQNLMPFNQRIKNKILNSGATGNSKIHSRIINSIRNPDSNAFKHYKLRTMCNSLSYVDYTPTLEHDYVNDRYPLLLSKYAAAIAATTYFPTIRYLEIPASGCLTFMEISEKNKGEYLGYVDRESAIFINEHNYKDKFEEYLKNSDDPKWERISNAGRDHAINNLNNDKAVDSLVDLMEELRN